MTKKHIIPSSNELVNKCFYHYNEMQVWVEKDIKSAFFVYIKSKLSWWLGHSLSLNYLVSYIKSVLFFN